MNRLRRKIRVCGADGQRSIEQIEWRNVMGDIDDRYFRIDLEDHAFKRADQVVVSSIVRCQCNNGVGHKLLPLLGIVRALRATK